MHSRATDRRSAPKCQGKWPDKTLDQAFGLPEVLVAVDTSRLDRENANIDAGLGFIWRISANRRHKACRACAASGHAIEPPIVTMNCCRRMSDCEITSHGVTHMQRRDFTTVSGHVSSSYASN